MLRPEIGRRPSLSFVHNESNPVPSTKAKRQLKEAVQRQSPAPPTPSEHADPIGKQIQCFSGAEFGYYNTPKIPHIYYFNPGLIDYLGKRWLVCRRSFFDYGHWHRYRTGISVFEIGANRNLSGEVYLKWPKRHELEQTDDPRVSIINGRLNLSACCWKTPDISNPKPVVVHQSLAEMDGWNVSRLIDPEYGGNSSSLTEGTGMEKNWLWFECDGSRWCIYNHQPMTVLREYGGKIVEVVSSGAEVNWPYGHIRGGAPPVLAGALYWSFFHSSLPWKVIRPVGMRNRYYAGVLAFENKPPFKIKKISKRPIIVGTHNEPTIPLAPPCVFPSGSIYDNGRWEISMGVNDCASAWLSIPYSEVERIMVDV